MRGAHVLNALFHPMQGIIPADAGSTGRAAVFALLIRDHPRGCGEHAPAGLGIVLELGSSPRMRGARPGENPVQGQWGIIPADAGSTKTI